MIDIPKNITDDSSLFDSKMIVGEGIKNEDIGKQKQEDGNDITLDHTPVLSDEMEIFSHIHEHDDHHAQKWKNKIKAFFLYFAGGVSIFALSVFGFISGSPSHEDLSANMLKDVSTFEWVETVENCISEFIKKSTADTPLEDFKKQEAYCDEKFNKNKNTSKYK